MKYKIDEHAALVLVDIQNDFLPGGALEVPRGDEIIAPLNAVIPKFNTVFKTQDWHPKNHESFAENHGKEVGEIIDLYGLTQILWPVHCVQNTAGAEFSQDLFTTSDELIILKGGNPRLDSYSGFFDNGHLAATGLDTLLKDRNISTLFVAGLATDYCVKFTVLDARELRYKVYVLEDAIRGVGLKENDIEDAIHEMKAKGATFINSKEIE